MTGIALISMTIYKVRLHQIAWPAAASLPLREVTEVTVYLARAVYLKLQGLRVEIIAGHKLDMSQTVNGELG